MELEFTLLVHIKVMEQLVIQRMLTVTLTTSIMFSKEKQMLKIQKLKLRTTISRVQVPKLLRFNFQGIVNFSMELRVSLIFVCGALFPGNHP